MDSGDLLRDGHGVVDGGNTGSALAAFDALLGHWGGGSRRIATDNGLIHVLLERPAVARLISELLGPAARPVRAIAFDKTAVRNWAVPWHQDRTIAVDRRDETADARCWTVKNGVDHCEPPVALLERMVTLRWHLDPVGPRDGCIRVLPGSHRKGRLTTAQIRTLLTEAAPVDAPVVAGAVFVMSPLLVHASRKRTTQGRRRVLHVELAADDPPAPLQWAWA